MEIFKEVFLTTWWCPGKERPAGKPSIPASLVSGLLEQSYFQYSACDGDYKPSHVPETPVCPHSLHTPLKAS